MTMIERLKNATTPPVLPRSVRRALEAMRTNLEHDWSVAGAGQPRRRVEPHAAAAIPDLPRQGAGAPLCATSASSTARRELLQGLPDSKVMDVAATLRLSA